DRQHRFTLPEFQQSKTAEIYEQIHLLGFHIAHPFSLLKYTLSSRLNALDLKSNLGKTIIIYGDLITLKKVRTKSGNIMYFSCFYDYNFKVFDTIHFPKIVQRYPIYGKGI